MADIKYPFGAAAVEALSATGLQAITINDALTLIDGVTTEASGNRTINLTIGDEVKVGAKVVVMTKSAAAQTETMGTGITGPVRTGVAGKTIVAEYVYNGTAFLGAGAEVQID